MKKLYPVVHVLLAEKAKENVLMAKENGADGVFLINHNFHFCSGSDLIELQNQIQQEVGLDFPVGVNCLDLGALETTFILNDTVPMFWSDDAMIVEGNEKQMEAQAVQEEIKDANWKGQYFGGVAFKYQRAVHDLETVTRVAAQYMDVVCTSGPATGVAAPIEKLRTMKSVLGEKSLAIASGITCANVLDYRESVDIFLVSTGISKDFFTFDPEKVKELADKIHSM